MIALRDVRFEHTQAGQRSFSLDIPALDIEAGQIVACIGPSGSGKTTLLHLIAGVLTPSAGSVRVLDHEVSSLPDARRRELRLTSIGMVFQEFELLEYLTARENILIASRLSPATPRAAHIEHLARATGITALLDRKPARLSQGERQRVALCRALALEPKLILCDEPTGNLDPVTTASVLDLLIAQARALSATVMVVTHNHDTLSRFDRVIDITPMSSHAALPMASHEGRQ